MLVQLSQHDISNLWDSHIKPAFINAAPPTTLSATVFGPEMLGACLTELVQVYVIVDEKDHNKQYGIMATQVQAEYVTGFKTLLIYAMHHWDIIPATVLSSTMESLREVARGFGCQVISMYTPQKQVVNMLAHYARSESTCLYYCVVPVGEAHGERR